MSEDKPGYSAAGIEPAAAESKGAGLLEALRRGWDDGLDLEDGIEIAAPFDAELVTLRAEVERLSRRPDTKDYRKHCAEIDATERLTGAQAEAEFWLLQATSHCTRADQAEARVLRLETALRGLSLRIRQFTHSEMCNTSDEYEPGDPCGVDGCQCTLALVPEIEALLTAANTPPDARQ